MKYLAREIPLLLALHATKKEKPRKMGAKKRKTKEKKLN